MIGLILGNRYELIEKIGEGGMSEVYRAKCNKLNRFVAVKILKKEFCDNEDIINKFKREATAIATLSDNNIVNVLDVGTQDDLNYIVMEYVKGKTLKDAIVQFGKLNYETCVTIGVQIARALDCAHRNNIIHRDVKPQNILVTEEGVIKVTDFGIAKSASSATLTNTTTIMGSAHYFSPEQAKGSFIDSRTDIYSLGVVLYEMSTGKLPFEGESPVTIALKHIQEAVVPPKQLNSRIPESLNNVILKAMEKDPNKRYDNVKELIADLQKIKENPDVVLGAVMSESHENHTIVMDAVKPPVMKKEASNHLKEPVDEYYDEDEEDDEDDYNERRKSSGKKKGPNKTLIGSIIAVVLLLSIGVGAFFLFSGKSEPREETVMIPKIVGLTKEEGKKAIEDAGLVYKETMENSDEKEAGIILRVTPNEGGSVKKGSEVKVIVSAGKSTMKFADYTKQNVDRVKEQITREFKIKAANIIVREEHSEDVSVGMVMRQEPEAGSPVTEDSTVTLIVSKGKETKLETVPELKGFTKAGAENALKALGLKANFVEKEVSDKSQDGIVLENPTNAGKKIEVGSSVTVIIGKYKEAEVVTFDISWLEAGMTKQEVIDGLDALGMKLNVDYKIQPDGAALKSWSPNKSKIKKGEMLTLTFG